MDYNKALQSIELKGLPFGMGLWYGNEPGEPVEPAKRLIVNLMFAKPDSFLRACYIQTNEGEKRRLEPTPAQMEVAQAYQDNRWIYVSKYRQAMISTVSAMLMLRDTMYGEAIKTAIVAQDRDTCDEIMDRIIFAYENLPEELRNPLKKGTKATRERIEFANGNQITSITVGSKSPGVGKSRDRVLITEACEMDDETLGRLQEKLFPAVENRPNARVIFETTPGAYGGRQYRLWDSCVNPKPGVPNRFKAVFLKWWLDERRKLKDPETGDYIELGPLTDEEKTLMAKMPGSTRHNMYFRRATLPATFDNNAAAFENKYPSGPMDGWSTKTNKIFDGDAASYLREMREEAANNTEIEGPSGLWEWVAPDPKSYYIFLVDPANFGSQGDFSAISVFDAQTWEEVASWEGRVQPTELHKIIKKAIVRYRQIGTNPMDGHSVIIESNAGALLGIAVNEMRYNIWYETHASGNKAPGWRAGTKSLQEAEANLDVALKEKAITIHSPTGLQQLINFDGQNRDRRIKKGKHTSHFDLARTYAMAAWALTNCRWPRSLTDDELRQKEAELASHLHHIRNMEDRAQMERLNMNLRLRGRRSNPNENNPWAPGAGWQS